MKNEKVESNGEELMNREVLEGKIYNTNINIIKLEKEIELEKLYVSYNNNIAPGFNYKKVRSLSFKKRLYKLQLEKYKELIKILDIESHIISNFYHFDSIGNEDYFNKTLVDENARDFIDYNFDALVEYETNETNENDDIL